MDSIKANLPESPTNVLPLKKELSPKPNQVKNLILIRYHSEKNIKIQIYICGNIYEWKLKYFNFLYLMTTIYFHSRTL